MRPVALSRLQQGINRQRYKGQAAPTQLYDLVNAYINSDGSVLPREGTLRSATCDFTTKGLLSLDSVFNIFGNSLTGTESWLLTPAASGGSTGFSNNLDSGVFGTLAPTGASLAGCLVNAFYQNGQTFVITLAGNPGPVTKANFTITFTDKNSTAWTLTMANNVGSSSPTTATCVVTQDTTNNYTTYTFTYTGTPPQFTAATVYTIGSLSPALIPSGYTYSSLVDPNYPYMPLEKIWFAKPFMGFPYIVAEFANSDVYHYWLQNSGNWAANTVEYDNTLILPNTSTGLAYQATRVSQTNPTWESEVSIPTSYPSNSPVLLLHFDGTNGSTTTVDSSYVGTAIHFGGAAALETSHVLFGTAALSVPGPNAFYSPQGVYTDHYAPGSALDILRLTDWTIEFAVNMPANGVTAFGYGTDGFNPGVPAANPNGQMPIYIIVSSGTMTITVADYSAFGVGTQFSGSLSYTTGTWVQIAVVKNGDGTNIVVYANGVSVGSGGFNWLSYNYTNGGGANCVCIGPINASYNPGNYAAAYFDEVRVTPAALYTAAYTPATAAFPTGQTLIGYTVEPSEYTGFQYRVVAVEGTAPHTGQTEPSWPTTAGALIQEFGDFDASLTDAGTTQPTTTSTSEALAPTITDRYGDSSTIANGGTALSSGVTLPTTASQTVTTWAAGTLYAPGAVVQPSVTQGAYLNAIPNGDFENGNDGSWTFSGTNLWAYTNTGPYQGNECLTYPTSGSTASGPGDHARMTNYAAISPGTSVTATGYLNPNNTGANLVLELCIDWYDKTDTFISEITSAAQEGVGYRLTTVTGVAPANAAHVRISVRAGTNTTHRNAGYADLISWNLSTPSPVSNFLYEAIQTNSATSSSTQPVWPTTAGATVIDGGVTWEAVGTSIITWEAIPIMQSGATEPTWPIAVGNSVIDPSTYTAQDGGVVTTNTSWVAASRRITDSKCPNTIAVVLGASHVFAGDKDLTDYSAAVDPTDWTSSNNAGYLPTGLNSYGDNPVAVLALYRSNLMVFNAGGYQMWQIDPDPANMALLDAQPVGSIWPQAAQSVANDVLFLTEVGVRNIGTAGANANLQIGNLGQPIDVLIKAQLDAGTYQPISLYYPGRGQYWLIFGPQAFVLTVNGTGLKTWSRYIFPDTITDWALNAGVLYLRTQTNAIWQFDDATLYDDLTGPLQVAFASWQQWPYLDLNSFGGNKFFIGVDLVGSGQVTIQVGFREDDPTTLIDNAGFSTSQNVTTPYTINMADTTPGTPIPIPVTAPSISLVLSWVPGQAWYWNAANLYLADDKGAGFFT